MQEMQELMEMVTMRGRKVRAAVMGVKMEMMILIDEQVLTSPCRRCRS